VGDGRAGGCLAFLAGFCYILILERIDFSMRYPKRQEERTATVYRRTKRLETHTPLESKSLLQIMIRLVGGYPQWGDEW
jgi:hypothetical protein